MKGLLAQGCVLKGGGKGGRKGEGRKKEEKKENEGNSTPK